MRTALLMIFLVPASAWAQDSPSITTAQLFKSVEMWLPTDYDMSSKAATHLRQGVNLFRDNRLIASANEFTAAHAADARLPSQEFWLATMIASLGRFDQSYDYLDRAIKDAPDDPRVWGLYAIIEYQQQRYGATLALLDKAENLLATGTLDATFRNRCRYQLLSVRGRTSDIFGMWEQALSCFRELNTLKQDPVFVLASAKMLSRLRREDEARDLLSTAEFKDQYDGSPESYLASWANEQGEFDAADKWFTIAVKNQPQDARVAFNNGLNLRALGRYRDAYAELDRCARLGHADLAAIEMQKGYVMFAQREFSAAEQHFSIVHSAAPSSIVATTFYALALAESSDSSKLALSKTLGQRLVERDGASYGDAATAGWIDYRLGQKDAALKSLDIAMSNPDDNTRYFRAVMFHDAGQSAQALELLEVISERSGMFAYRDSARALRDQIKATPAAHEDARP